MRARRPIAVTAAVALVLVLTACTSQGTSDQAATTTAEPCPVQPLQVVVTVDQWGDIVGQLAGACADVATIVTDTAVDPHDFEPSPADIARFSNADLVVMNGLGYDEWATKALDAVGNHATVVDAGQVVGLETGANPHIWYGPDYVHAVASAVTSELTALAPDAGDYFAQRAQELAAHLQPMLDEVGRLHDAYAGRPYAATEPVFTYMAAAIGLVDATPAGYTAASTNESEPSPGDVAAFDQLLRSGGAAVLIFNTQTAGALTDQLRSTAEGAGVPVVEVTETVAPGSDSFVSWQLDQLGALGGALSGGH